MKQILLHDLQKESALGLPGWLRGKESPLNAEDTRSIPGLGRSHMPGSN